MQSLLTEPTPDMDAVGSDVYDIELPISFVSECQNDKTLTPRLIIQLQQCAPLITNLAPLASALTKRRFPTLPASPLLSVVENFIEVSTSRPSAFAGLLLVCNSPTAALRVAFFDSRSPFSGRLQVRVGGVYPGFCWTPSQ
jgi:hypothetical protein